jgi:hypothetical protein
LFSIETRVRHGRGEYDTLLLDAFVKQAHLQTLPKRRHFGMDASTNSSVGDAAIEALLQPTRLWSAAEIRAKFRSGPEIGWHLCLIF